MRSRAWRALPGWRRCWPAPALAQATDGSLDADTLQRIQALGEQAGAGLAPGAMRVEIEPGRLDPRLRLAPCERIEPYLPPGARAWGRSRVGLRCVQGPTPWNVYLPVTVKVFAPAWVAASALPAGSELQPEHAAPGRGRLGRHGHAAGARRRPSWSAASWPGRCRPAPPCARAT